MIPHYTITIISHPTKKKQWNKFGLEHWHVPSSPAFNLISTKCLNRIGLSSEVSVKTCCRNCPALLSQDANPGGLFGLTSPRRDAGGRFGKALARPTGSVSLPFAASQSTEFHALQ